MKLPLWLTYLVVTMIALSWVPIALIMRARVTTTSQPRIHIIPDMDNQPRYSAQSRNVLFADRRAMRPPVQGTVARGSILGETDVVNGKLGDEWVAAIPTPVQNLGIPT